MLKLDTLPRNKARTPYGFTLLELLLVLAIISMMAGIAIPKTDAAYNSFKRASERDDALLAIANLGYTAYSKGITFSIQRYPLPVDSPLSGILNIPIPEGWKLLAEKPVVYRYNGVCDGGNIRLYTESHEITLHLEPPFCVPAIVK